MDARIETPAGERAPYAHGEDWPEGVITKDGAVIETDFDVVDIGVAPRTGLVETADLKIDDGVVVELGQRAQPGPGRGQGGARLGRELRRESYDEIPYFFSDQYDAGMEYSGYATQWDGVVFRGDVAAREFIAFWLKDDRVVAGMRTDGQGG